MEQRNGRLDRHGQARDVTVFHFTSDDDADIRFLGYVLSKVHTIRHDLGSTGEVFDAAFQKQLIEGRDAGDVRRDLDLALEKVKGRAQVPFTSREVTGEDEAARLEALKAELDLSPETLQQVLDVSLGIGIGRPRLKGPDGEGHVRFEHPIPPTWSDLVNDTVRIQMSNENTGALPSLTFDPTHHVQMIGGRPVFRPQRDTALLHLAHPVFRRALTELSRMRFPGGSGVDSRWTVRRASVPDGVDALVLLTVEELAVNELREALHHWVRTFRLPVIDGELAEALPHLPARELRAPVVPATPADVQRARDIWADVSVDVRRFLRDYGADLTTRLQEAMAEDLTRPAGRAERFQAPGSSLISSSRPPSSSWNADRRPETRARTGSSRPRRPPRRPRQQHSREEDESRRRQL